MEKFKKSCDCLRVFHQEIIIDRALCNNHYENRKSLTRLDKEYIIKFKEEQSLYENFIKKQKSYKPVFEEMVKNNQISKEYFDHWCKAVNYAEFVLLSCFVNLDSIKEKYLKIEKDEQYEYQNIKLGKFDCKLRVGQEYTPYKERGFPYGMTRKERYDNGIKTEECEME